MKGLLTSNITNLFIFLIYYIFYFIRIFLVSSKWDILSVFYEFSNWSQTELLIFLFPLGIAVLLNRINKPKVTVAVDGSLYRFHPHFHELMMEKIQDLLNPGIKVG